MVEYTHVFLLNKKCAENITREVWPEEVYCANRRDNSQKPQLPPKRLDANRCSSLVVSQFPLPHNPNRYYFKVYVEISLQINPKWSLWWTTKWTCRGAESTCRQLYTVALFRIQSVLLASNAVRVHWLSPRRNPASVTAAKSSLDVCKHDL